MELDKRIRAIVDILTVINSDMGGIIGKTGYFGNSIMDFKRLDTCEHGELTGIIRNTDRCFEYENCGDSGRQGYCYFIPEDWVKPEESEKKYRPYTLAEWIEQHEIGEVIHFSRNEHKQEFHVMYTGYVIDNGEDIQDIRTTGRIMLINMGYLLQSLFNDNYEICINGEWQPFGVIEE